MAGIHPTADAIALTLWLIVAALVGCAIASLAMVRAQPATPVVGITPEPREVELAGDAG